MLGLNLVPIDGYCDGLHPDTTVLLSNGDIRAIKDLKIGDSLYGVDSLSKLVLETHSDISNLYRVTPSKGSPFICSERFRLTLKGTNPYITTSNSNTAKKFSVRHSQLGHLKMNSFRTEEEAQNFLNSLSEDIFEISLADYMTTNKNFKHRTFLFHQGLNFEPRNVPIDPYMIGYWLGDGTGCSPTITTADPEIVDYFIRELPKYGLQLTKLHNPYAYNICGLDENYGTKGANVMINTLRDLNMFNNKHIPDLYKRNSREIRLKLLAGLIDSDGYNDRNTIEIVQKSDKLSDDIQYLVFSLGFMFTRVKCNKSCMYKGEVREGVYNRMNIFSEGMEDIPVVLGRKKCRERIISKRATCQNFKIEPLGTGFFSGFIMEGNGRFLTSDFTVLNSK